jgi:signal transduction histidine kinase
VADPQAGVPDDERGAPVTAERRRERRLGAAAGRSDAAGATGRAPICIVSSDPAIHRSLGHLLAGSGYRVVRATSLRGLARHMVAGTSAGVVDPRVVGLDERSLGQWLADRSLRRSSVLVLRPDEIADLAGEAPPEHAASLIANVHTLVTGGEQLEYDRLYTQAVATVTHELKTPLTSIRGFAQMLRDDQLDPEEIREFAAEIHDSAVRLTRYVESILTEDAFHTGGVALELRDVRLAPVVGQVLRELEPWGLHRHRLVNGVDESIAVRADVDRLTQVISNLVTNAVKYSPAGGTVSVDAVVTSSEVEIIVEDEGIGIAPEERLRVFDRFYRVPSAVSTGIAGTGLGLSIVGNLVKLHGGRIWVTDGPGGRGSRFHVCLPAAVAPARPTLLPDHQGDDLPFVAVVGGSVDRRRQLTTTTASQPPGALPQVS